MYPNLFGIENFSYTLCMVLGIILAILVAAIYLKKQGLTKDGLIDLLICACFAVASGVIFSIWFENLYELIQYKENYSWTWGMTFYGGLFGGIIGFLLTYYFLRKNVNFDIVKVAKIAPLSIVIAHAVGRIGCFLAGCCHGKATESWIGIDFPGTGKVIPTQLFESVFLFILFAVMLVLLLKYDFKYNFVVYMGAYGIFRFVIEFFRGDPRGVAFFFSPSQVWSILLLLGAFPIYLLIKWLFKKQNEAK